MQTPLALLQNVRVAKPCPAAWSAMESIEGDRVRHCDGCKKNVYNLSAMTQAEAEGLLRKHEGRLCVRYYQRYDGTVLTADCPVGVQAVRQMFLRRSVATAALFLIGLVAMAGSNSLNDTMNGSKSDASPEARAVVGGMAPVPATVTPQSPETMTTVGEIAPEPKAVHGQAVLGRHTLGFVGDAHAADKLPWESKDTKPSETTRPDEQNDH